MYSAVYGYCGHPFKFSAPKRYKMEEADMIDNIKLKQIYALEQLCEGIRHDPEEEILKI